MFTDGRRFATGATTYQYRPATAHETTPRLILAVELDGILTEAVVDTGGIYLLCSPPIARLLHVDTAEAISVRRQVALEGSKGHGPEATAQKCLLEFLSARCATLTLSSWRSRGRVFNLHDFRPDGLLYLSLT